MLKFRHWGKQKHYNPRGDKLMKRTVTDIPARCGCLQSGTFVGTRNNKVTGKQNVKPAGTIVAGVVLGRPYQSPFSVR